MPQGGHRAVKLTNKALRLGPGYLSGFPASGRQTHRQREAGQSLGGAEACWEVAARPGEGCDPDSPALLLSGRILSLLTSHPPATLHPDPVLWTLILGSALLCRPPARGSSGALGPVVQRGQHCWGGRQVRGQGSGFIEKDLGTEPLPHRCQVGRGHWGCREGCGGGTGRRDVACLTSPWVKGAPPHAQGPQSP